MLLSGIKFQSILEKRFKISFDEIDSIPAVNDIFRDLSPWIDTNLYEKLLSYVDTQQFIRFMCTCLNKYFGDEFKHSATNTLDMLHGDPRLQLICIACIQYYFA